MLNNKYYDKDRMPAKGMTEACSAEEGVQSGTDEVISSAGSLRYVTAQTCISRSLEHCTN